MPLLIQYVATLMFAFVHTRAQPTVNEEGSMELPFIL